MPRTLVSIRTISSIDPIPGADAIVCASVDGWKVVVKRGEFTPGDPCMFFEIDSFLPASDARFAFMSAHKRLWRGKEGYRVRTVTLRGQLSQGLALPLHLFPEGVPEIEKWEPEIPVALQGEVQGNFPDFIPKTDQERVQNVWPKITPAAYEATLKLDGTSLTVFRHEGQLGVCSRNLRLKLNETNQGNLYVRMAELFENIPDGFAVQAEICGPGVQANRAGFGSVSPFVFDVFDISAKRYLLPSARRALCEKMQWPHVPVVADLSAEQFAYAIQSVSHALAWVEGLTYDNGLPAEGAVFKPAFDNGLLSFKTINNNYLRKYDL